MKYQFIHQQQRRHTVTRLCEVLEVSRSGYYAWCGRGESRRAQANQRLLQRIQHLHLHYRCRYGADKLWRVLRAEGETCGRHRVARLRREQGIEALRRRRFKARYAACNSQAASANQLHQNFKATHPDRVWVGDTTFITTRAGWLFLAVVIDLYARRVVGWSMSYRNNQALVVDALTMAIEQRAPLPGLIHHTDQGATYRSAVYQALLKQHGMVPSMSRKGNCYDNAVAESFFSTLKNELVFFADFKTREEARSAIFEFIEVFYNRQRHHQSLNYQIPIEYEKMLAVA
jgi:transposase InsO family protein